ncbi:MAG: response regulator transcription factor [Comamonadaceae bacterium]|nr:response regulator transcription factor [Comamonadaceae bacterium]
MLLADDHLMVAEALKSLLAPEFDLVGVVEDGRALVEAAGTLRPDVIVADITMPHLNGIDALVQLRQRGDRVPVVFLTMHRDVSFARRALDAGASGFVLKHSAPAELVVGHPRRARGQDLPDAAARGRGPGVDEAGAGAGRRPARLPHAAAARGAAARWPKGARRRRSPRALGISPRTVEFHKYQMMEALGLHTNAELIHFAIKHGLVER